MVSRKRRFSLASALDVLTPEIKSKKNVRLLECRFFWFVFVFFGSIDHRKVPCDALLVVVFRLLIRLKMNCDYNKRSNFNFVCFLPSLINGRFFYAVW